MDILQRHKERGPAAAALLEKACSALGNITVTDNQARCGAAGGVEVVLDILRRHNDGPAAAALLQQACGALAQITANSANFRASADNLRKCRAANGQVVLREVRGWHSTNAAISSSCNFILKERLGLF